MNNVRFQVGGATFSYGGFYRGFGLFITAFQIFSAFLAWHLGAMVRRQSQELAVISWGFVAMQVVSFALSVIYFSVIPSIFSALLAVCLAWATLLARPQSVTRRVED